MSDDNEDGLAFQYICSHSRLLYVNMHIPFTDKEDEPMAQVNISSLRCVSIHINQVTVAPPNGQLFRQWQRKCIGDSWEPITQEELCAYLEFMMLIIA